MKRAKNIRKLRDVFNVYFLYRSNIFTVNLCPLFITGRREIFKFLSSNSSSWSHLTYLPWNDFKYCNFFTCQNIVKYTSSLFLIPGALRAVTELQSFTPHIPTPWCMKYRGVALKHS